MRSSVPKKCYFWLLFALRERSSALAVRDLCELLSCPTPAQRHALSARGATRQPCADVPVHRNADASALLRGMNVRRDSTSAKRHHPMWSQLRQGGTERLERGVSGEVERVHSAPIANILDVLVKRLDCDLQLQAGDFF
jgi:hypothetical protein